MGLYPTIMGNVTLGAGINDITASGLQTVYATLIAHPSNSGILYVRERNSTTMGFPLAAGERLTIDLADLYDYTVSGASSQRLAYIAKR